MWPAFPRSLKICVPELGFHLHTLFFVQNSDTIFCTQGTWPPPSTSAKKPKPAKLYISDSGVIATTWDNTSIIIKLWDWFVNMQVDLGLGIRIQWVIGVWVLHSPESKAHENNRCSHSGLCEVLGLRSQKVERRRWSPWSVARSSSEEEDLACWKLWRCRREGFSFLGLSGQCLVSPTLLRQIFS